MQAMISAYIHMLYEESIAGELTVSRGACPFTYPVAWEAKTPEELSQQCVALIEQLTVLAGRNTGPLTGAQREIWNTYLKPFPQHDMDMDALRAVWKKDALGLVPTGQEQQLSIQYDRWYEENALKRLPWKGCAPTGLIRQARRYAKQVQRQVPAALLAYEARCLAEEFVLYHCMQP